MTEEGSFLRAILAKPADDLPRLVYADWLEEQQTDEAGVKAEYLRLVVAFGKGYGKGQHHIRDQERVQELAERLPVGWLAAVSHAAVENCAPGGTAIRDWRLRRSLETVSFAFECPKDWSAMQPTDDERVRHCTACGKNVYFCHTVDEARSHARVGDCVAVSPSRSRSSGDLEMDDLRHRLSRVRPTAGIVAPGDWDEGETLREES